MFIALLDCCYIQDGEGSQILRWDKKVGTISGWVLCLWHKYGELENTVCVGPITQQTHKFSVAVSTIYLPNPKVKAQTQFQTRDCTWAIDILIMNPELFHGL